MLNVCSRGTRGKMPGSRPSNVAAFVCFIFTKMNVGKSSNSTTGSVDGTLLSRSSNIMSVMRPRDALATSMSVSMLSPPSQWRSSLPLSAPLVRRSVHDVTVVL